MVGGLGEEGLAVERSVRRGWGGVVGGWEDGVVTGWEGNS